MYTEIKKDTVRWGYFKIHFEPSKDEAYSNGEFFIQWYKYQSKHFNHSSNKWCTPWWILCYKCGTDLIQIIFWEVTLASQHKEKIVFPNC